MPIRITGLNSGLDTESIISALVSSYNYKTQKYKKAQTKLSWKQDAWKGLNTKIYSLYTNVGNLRFSSAYNIKTATVSDSTKVSITAGSSATNGSYSVQVTSLAKSGYLTGDKIAKGTTGSTKISELTGDELTGRFSLTVDGKQTDIEVGKDDTVQSVVNKMKEAGVNASYDASNLRIYISAKDTGEERDFTLAAMNEKGSRVLTALGINVADNVDMKEYEGLAQYASWYDVSTDAAKEASIKRVMDIVSGKQDALKAIDAAEAEINNYNKVIQYVNAAQAVNNVAKLVGTNNLTESDYTKLKNLTQEGSLAHKKIASDGTIYTYNITKNKYIAEDGTEKEQSEMTEANGYTDAETAYKELAKKFGLIVTETKDGKDVENSEKLTEFKKNLSTMKSIQKGAESNTELKTLLENADTAVANGTVDGETGFKQDCLNKIDARKALILDKQENILNANPEITADMYEISTSEDEEVVEKSIEAAKAKALAFLEKAVYAEKVMDAEANKSSTGGVNAILASSYNQGAVRINGSSAAIWVNGVEYTGSSNIFSINGMTITATGVTSTDTNGDRKVEESELVEANAVNVTVNTDIQGVYDKVKDFLTQYNALINELTSLYNADSAKGYEPLSDEERDAMSDAEIEKWETKIKGSLLRRDTTLSGIISAMTNSMAKGVQVKGETYYLSNFGIKTLGYLNAMKNEHNAYHIDGDEDDLSTSGKEDKLMKAIAEDPDTVLEFMQGLATNLYKAVDSKMKATTLSSTYTVYNDKEMASEYSDYTTMITKWQERLETQEEYYYQKFAAMETALSKLNSQTSSLSGLFGS